METAGDSTITEEIRSMIGTESGPQTYKIERSTIEKFADVIDDTNPLWRDKAYAKKRGFTDIIAPPTFLVNLYRLKQDEWALSVKCPLSRVLAGGSEMESFQPVMPGDLITVTGKLIQAYERDGKAGKLLFLIFERNYKNQIGELVTKVRQAFIRH